MFKKWISVAVIILLVEYGIFVSIKAADVEGNDRQIIAMADKTPGMSAFFSQGANQDAFSMSKVFGTKPTGKIVFEASIKLADQQTDRTKYTKRELFNISGGTNNPTAISLIRITDGYIRDRYTNALLMYAQGTWYNIKVVVDFASANQPVEYYIDDVRIYQNPANGAAIPSTLSVADLSDFATLKNFSYTNANDSCETYLDDIKVYQIQDAYTDLPESTGDLKCVAFDFYKNSISEANRVTKSGLTEGKIYGTVTFANSGEEDTEAMLIMGVYDGKALRNVIFSPVQSINAGACGTLSANVQVVLPDSDEADNYYIKLLVWSGIGNMKPVCAPIRFDRK